MELPFQIIPARLVPTLGTIFVAACMVTQASAQWTTDSLSQGRYTLAATTADSTALFAGGGPFGTGSDVDVVDLYDVQTCTWTTSALTQPRTSLAATGYEGRAYFGGGFGSGMSDRVDVYDAASGMWTIDTLSVARTNLAAASAGGKVVFAGGRVNANTSVRQVDVLDVGTNTWTQTRLSQGRHDLAATSVGDLILFAGGTVSTTAMPSSTRVDIYDTQTSSWTTSDLSTGRTELGATTVGNLAVFAGGRSQSTLSDRVDIYDSRTGTWTTATLSMPRFGIAATTVGHLAIFAGGAMDNLFNPTDVVDIYNATTNTWSTTTLSTVRYLPVATTVDGRAFFAGGLEGVGGGTDVVDIYDARIGAPFCNPAIPNTTGVPARIRAFGSTLVAAGDLTLFAEALPPGEFGYFLVGSGTNQVNPPGSLGILCLAGNSIGRYNQASNIIQGPLGTIGVNLAALPLSPAHAVQAGETWNFQCWFRDQGTSNFTDAVTIAFQ
ncbi:MAG: hypothetical protein GY711_09700 [bacterium]|nr:hypothetical protein [bacterium]